MTKDFELAGYPIDLEQIPVDWKVCPLSMLIVDVVSGSAAGQSMQRSSGVPHMRPMNITVNGRLDFGDVRFIDPSAVKRNLRPGDVLFNNTNSPALVGKSALLDVDAELAFSNHMTRIRLNEDLMLPAFLALQLYALQRMGYFETHCRKHVNQASVSADFLLTRVPLVVPAIPDQSSVVSLLESARDMLDRAAAKVNDAQTHISSAQSALIDELFRGGLGVSRESDDGTVDLMLAELSVAHRDAYVRRQLGRDEVRLGRELTDKEMDILSLKHIRKYAPPVGLESTGVLPALPAGWRWASAAQVVTPGSDIVYGIVQPGTNLRDGVPYVRGVDIQSGQVRTDNLLRTDPAIAARYARSSLIAGDVLLGIIRATKVAVVPEVLEGANITQGTARLRPSNCISSDYLATWLRSEFAQSWLHAHYRGIDMPGLNLADVRRLPVPVAPLDDQARLTQLSNTIGFHLSTARQRAAAARDSLRSAEESLLLQTFNGVLAH